MAFTYIFIFISKSDKINQKKLIKNYGEIFKTF